MSRPFWGGLLTLLAGLEIFGTTQMGGDGLRLQFGPTGFLSWLIPTILIACGLLMWFTPQQRMFYAVVAVVTAVFSLIAVNLGGFLVGLLLGMVGGALGFAWTPRGPSTEPESGDLPDEAQPAAPPSGADPPRTGPSAGGTFVAVLVLACLAAAALTVTGGDAPARAAPCASASATRPAPPAASGTGSPTPGVTSSTLARSTPAPSVSASRGTDGAGDDGTGDGGGEKQTAARSSPDPTPSPDPRPSTEPTPDQTPGPVRPGTCPTGTPASPTPEDESVVPKLAPEPGQPMVNREPSLLTGSKVTMYGLRLDGIVDLPTADGPLRTLRFSMRRAVTDDFDLRISGTSGRTLDFRSSALTVDGHVRFYATSFTGSFLGIPLTLTPASPLPPDGIPVTVPLIVFDDPQMRLAFVECDELTAPNLDESLR